MAGSRRHGVSPILIDPTEAPEVDNRDIHVEPRKSRKIAFGWYGGKFTHLGWLLPLLPKTHGYCEPFGGSASVLLNREPSPVETYNDLDGDVTNFFRVLRTETEELMKQISLTPFSREEFYRSIYDPTEGDSDLERARKFYVRARQARTGMAQTATLGRWANCKTISRAGMSGSVSRWLHGSKVMDEIAERLMRVQIENRPAIDAIEVYDGPDTLLYCDPPYVHESRGDSKVYGFEMSEQQHRELADALKTCDGKVAISGYHCDLMDELYGHYERHDAPVKTCHSTKTPRQECLWTNY
jgi:DNA adenine methylase